VLLFLVLLSAFYWFDRFDSHHKTVTTLLDRIAGKTKIVVGLIQVTSDVVAAFSYIPWPVALLYVASKLKTIGMNLVQFTNTSCFGEDLRMNALVRAVFSVAMQALFVVSIFFYYRIRHRVLPKLFPNLSSNSSPESISLVRRSCFRNSWWLIFLCYPSTVTYIVAILPYKRMTCIELCQYEGQIDCPWRLKADLSLLCDYNEQKIAFCLCFIIYVIGLPGLATWALLKRHRIHSHLSDISLTTASVYDSQTDRDSVSPKKGKVIKDLMDSLEFLDENYKFKFWYWELVEMLRKLLLTCGVQYLGSSGVSGLAVASMISNVFLMLHAQFKPFKRKSEHWLQLFSLLLVSCNLMMATLMALQQAEEEESNTDSIVFSVIVVTINAGFVVYVGVKILVSVWMGLKAARKTARQFKCMVCVLVCLTREND
jgi:hypothetical protein